MSTITHFKENKNNNSGLATIFKKSPIKTGVSGGKAYLKSEENEKNSLKVVKRWSKADKIASMFTMLLTGLWLGWRISVNGYANSFYAAAAQAGSKSWEAFLWGSLDSSNAITIDKPPLGVWLPALSIRLFGLSSWSLLLPQVLMGVATVGLIFAMVRRYFNWKTATLASLFMVMTPIVTLMFRFNNPDALLILFMVAAIYLTLRAVEDGKNKWLVACGIMIGLGFLTKQFQVLLITPAIAITYLMAGPHTFGKRIIQGLYCILASIVSAGWWVLLTILVPASDRPYIGGSQHNSFIELTFGYNGLGRLTGNETGSVGGGKAPGGGGGGNAMGGATGLGRLFTETYNSQWSWLAPAALIFSIGALTMLWKRSRRDMQKSMIIIWALWLIVTGITFSFMSGIFHQYYTVALAPAVAILVATGIHITVSQALQNNWRKIPAITTILTAALTTILWSFHIATETAYMGWLKWSALTITIISTSILLGVFIMENNKNNDTINNYSNYNQGAGYAPRQDNYSENVKKTNENFFTKLSPVKKGIVSSLATLGIAGIMALPVAWSANTVNNSHTGSIVTAGPNSAGGMGGGPGGQGSPGSSRNNQSGGVSGNQGQSPNNSTGGQGTANQGSPNGQNGSLNGQPNGGGTSMDGGQMGSGMGPGGTSQMGGGQMGSGNNGAQTGANSTTSTASQGQPIVNTGGGGMGGLLNGATVSKQMIQKLSENASNYKWMAATIGSQNAASYQLATEKPVMSIGGFNGSDPSPTLNEFKKYVTEKKIHYFISGGSFGGQNGGSSSGNEITNWVKNNFKASTIDGITIYDLTSKK